MHTTKWIWLFQSSFSSWGYRNRCSHMSCSGSYHRVQRRHQAGEDLLPGGHQRDLQLASGVGPDAVTCQFPHLSHASAGTRWTQFRQKATARHRQTAESECAHMQQQQRPAGKAVWAKIISFDFKQIEAQVQRISRRQEDGGGRREKERYLSLDFSGWLIKGDSYDGIDIMSNI